MNKKQFDKQYAIYLQSDDFDIYIRQPVIKRDKCCQNPACKLPYKRGEFDIHHTSYAWVGHNDINELESCTLLCKPCHKKIHGLPPDENIEDAADRIVGEW